MLKKVVFWAKTRYLEANNSSGRHENEWKLALPDSLYVSAYVGIKSHVAKDGWNGYLDLSFRILPQFWLEIDICCNTSPVPAMRMSGNLHYLIAWTSEHIWA